MSSRSSILRLAPLLGLVCAVPLSAQVVSNSGGTGNVTGPASSTNGDCAQFSGTTGKIIADSGGACGGSGMTTSGSNATSGALDAIATAAGQTGGLKQTDNPTFGTITTPGGLTAGMVNSTTSTLNGNLNINQANIFDTINVSSAVTSAYANPMNLLVPSLVTGYNIAFRVGTANSTNNAAQLIFNDNGGAGSSTNSVQMSLYAGVGGVTLTGTGALSLGGGSAANVTLASSAYATCAILTTVSNIVTCSSSLAGSVSASALSFTGSAPAVTACGTSPSIDGKATNNSGTVTVGTVAASSCTVTFASSGFTTWNHCRVTSQTTLAAFGYSYTTSVLTVTGTSLVGDKFDYECDGV